MIPTPPHAVTEFPILGRELFYRNGDAMMVLSVETEPTFTRGNPEVLFGGRYYRAPVGRY